MTNKLKQGNNLKIVHPDFEDKESFEEGVDNMYNQQTMRELFKHQKEGVAFLKEKKKAILADEMGLGKTTQAIVAGKESTKGSILVICPASLKINWSREIDIMYPGEKIQVIQSGKEQTIEKADWIIVNYDMLRKYRDQILGIDWIDTAIVDEAHYIKGKKTYRAVDTLAIVKRLENVYFLTGTPVMNRPSEIYNLLVGIDHILGRYGNKTLFYTRYCDRQMKIILKKGRPPIRFYDDSGSSNLEELREMTKDVILRRTKDEELDLPEKIISVQICSLDNAGRKRYDNAWEDYLEKITNVMKVEDESKRAEKIGNIMDAKHLVELTKLKQICSQEKVERMVSDIKNSVSQGEKVIVFTQYTDTIKMITEGLKQTKKASAYGDKEESVKYVTLTGKSSQDERQEAVDKFQNDPETKVFVANIIAGGVGITLTEARTIMFADMEWSPALHNQAEDRAHRIGQKNTVNVYYYVLEGTIEEDIVELLDKKKSIIQTIMDGTRDEEYKKSMASEFLEKLKERMVGKTKLGNNGNK